MDTFWAILFSDSPDGRLRKAARYSAKLRPPPSGRPWPACGRLLVVDEDYRECGLSGEVGAIALEAGLRPGYARVCLEGTIPFARHLEAKALPNVERIIAAARKLASA